MHFLSVLMMAVFIVFFCAIFLCFVGSISMENDKAKANRYLAELHDRDTAQ